MSEIKTKKYRVYGSLLLGDGFVLCFEMKYNHEDDVPLWAKCLGWNFERPTEEMICIIDWNNNDWIIETNKVLGWNVKIDEIND